MLDLANYQALILLALGFGFVIFVHELGHFLVAKAVGIKVTQFAIGFGPAAIAWRKGIGFRFGTTEPAMDTRIKEYFAQRVKETPDPAQGAEIDRTLSRSQIDEATAALGLGETEYRLNWLPLGGYVKMLGQEDMNAGAVSEDPRSFSRKPIWARACVISAGVIVNLIFGLIFLIIAFYWGVSFPEPVVGGVVQGAPAAKAGFKPGDRILTMNGTHVYDFSEVQVETALASKDRPIRFTVERPGTPGVVSLEVTPKFMKKSQGLLAIGIAPPISLALVEKPYELSDVMQKAGVQPGMKVTEVDARPIQRFDELRDAVFAAHGAPVTVTFKSRDGKTATMAISARGMLLMPEKEMAKAEEEDEPRFINPSIAGLVPATKIGEVAKGSPAEAAGLKRGDVLVRLNDAAWPDGVKLTELVKASGATAKIIVRRGNEEKTFDVKPEKDKLGINREQDVDSPIVAAVDPGSPFASLKLLPGTRIVRVDGKPVASFLDIRNRLAEALHLTDTRPADATSSVTVAYQLPLKEAPVTEAAVKLDSDARDELQLSLAEGWQLPEDVLKAKDPRSGDEAMPFKPSMAPVQSNNLPGAAVLGLRKTKQFMAQTYLTIYRLTQRSVPVSGMRGPLGIFEAGITIQKERGNAYLLFFLGIISVNLVVINFLPMPIVDGGLMVFLIVEKIKGSPVSPKVLNAANMVGLVMIGSVFLIVTYFDVARLIGG